MSASGVSVLDWVERTMNVGDEGLERQRQANEVERGAVAAALAVPACHSLEASYRLTQLARGRMRLAGRVRAVLIRTCVVELEDFEQSLDEPLEIEFWPESQLASDVSGPKDDQSAPPIEIAVDALEGEDPEPIRNGRLHVGDVIYQVLAAALDPFPRKPGAALDLVEAPAPTASARPNPFAVLRNLKPGDPSNEG